MMSFAEKRKKLLDHKRERYFKEKKWEYSHFFHESQYPKQNVMFFGGQSMTSWFYARSILELLSVEGM